VLAEVVMSAAAGGTNLIGGGTASASSYYDSRYLPSCACDGNPSTMWSANSAVPAWWGYDFGAGSAVNVGYVTLTTRNDGDSACNPNAFDVQYSDDNSTWTTAESFTAPTWTNGQTQSFTVAAAGHRYWRLYATASVYGSLIALSEISLQAVAGGPNLLTGGTVCTGGDYSTGGNPPSNLLDGNTSTWWGSTALPGWWGYDFGSGASVAVAAMALTPRNDAYANQGPSDPTLQYSDDGSAWTTLFTGTAGAWGAGTAQTFTAPPVWSYGAAFRFWRIYIATQQGGASACNLAEVQFRTTAGTALLFSGGTASAFDTNSSYVAANACDNNTSTFWCSNANGPGWWQYDYGAGNSLAVAEVAITCRSDGYAGQGAATWTLQCSNDGAGWASVQTFTAATWTAGSSQTFDVSGGGGGGSGTALNVTQVGAEVWLLNGATMATLTFDGVVTATASRSASVSAAITTSLPNDVIVVAAFAEWITAPAVTGVTAAGLTFAKLAAASGAGADMEIWWAPASAELSGATVTVTYDFNFDDASLCVFAVNGANTSAPWDMTAGLPATMAGSGITASFSGISTAAAGEMLIFAGGTRSPWSGSSETATGFTSIAIVNNYGAIWYSFAGFCSMPEPSVLSGATIAWGPAVPGDGACVLAALVPASTAPGSPVPLQVTQVGAEVWLAGIATLAATQVGAEVWLANAPPPPPARGAAETSQVWMQ